MNKEWQILVINPGSTSTKIAIYKNKREILNITIKHSVEKLLQFENIISQKSFRYNEIIKILDMNNFDFKDIDAIAARGGLIKPISSGTYEINEEMINDLNNVYGASHASSLAGLIAYDLKIEYDIPAYIIDPVVVDELQNIARLTGIPNQERISVFHALNQKAVAKKHSDKLNKKYNECNFIIAHMGGGITVAAHQNGQAIDVNNGIEGDGPFSVERCGSIPVSKIIDMCFKKDANKQSIKDLCNKTGGMVAHLQTNDLIECEKMINDGNKYALLVYQSMAYQVAKEIGAMAVVLDGNVDAIILTGGLAHSKNFIDLIVAKVKFISDIAIYPGENEMEALASGVLSVLTNQEISKEYL